MTMLHPQTGEIPAPMPSVLSQPYWDGCKRKELLYQRCSSCGRGMPTPAPVCRWCLTETLEWTKSEGRGRIYSYSIVWRPQSAVFTTPYAPAIVELTEGFQVLSNIIGCDCEELAVGMPVEVTFHEIRDGAVLPYFQPIQGAGR
jgi:uncharacterized OB-fold protein